VTATSGCATAAVSLARGGVAAAFARGAALVGGVALVGGAAPVRGGGLVRGGAAVALARAGMALGLA
jgi:hypothetical protein